MTDDDLTALVVAARRGDADALAELVRETLPLVTTLVRRSLDPADADDAVQETYVRVVRHLGGLREPERFRSWLLSIALREARRRGRARQDLADRVAPEEVADLPDDADLEDATIARLGLRRQRLEVAEATGWLDRGDREVLALWWLELAGRIGRGELAEALDTSPAYAAVRVQRARERLDAARALVRSVHALHTPFACPGLDRTLRGWDGERTPRWRKRALRHVEGCERCGAVRAGLLRADRLLGVGPMAAVPTALVHHVLAGAGAPPAGGVAVAGWAARARHLVHGGKAAAVKPVAVVAAAAVTAGAGAVAWAGTRPDPRPVPRAIVAAAPMTAPAARPAPAVVPRTTTRKAAPRAAAKPALPRAGARLVPGPIPLPAGLMPSVKAYGAKGDGRTDDTAAIQRALDDGRRGPDGASLFGADENYSGRPKALYFPPGTYLVSRTVDWVGCCVTIMGAGSHATTLRLADRAAGFANAKAPRPLLRTPAGNQEFRHYLRDFRVDLGRGNPGAVGLDVIGSNTSSVRDVDVTAAGGVCSAGLDLTRSWPGPMLLADVRVTGCDDGIRTGTGEYGVTLERITLRGQHRAGLRNLDNTLSVRLLESVNTVPAVVNAALGGRAAGDGIGSIALLDSSLVTPGGSSRSAAIENAANLHVRGVTTRGYGTAIRDRGRGVRGGTVREYLSGSPVRLHPGTTTSLGLAVRETPTFTADPRHTAVFRSTRYGSNPGLARALRSGASTVYVAWGVYFQWDQLVVDVPPTVRRIVGFGAHMNTGQGRGGGGVRFVVRGDSRTPLIVENIQQGVTVEHVGRRPVALVDGGFRYVSHPGAGDLYLEDVVMGPLTVQRGQHVWARQFNDEADPGAPKIVNNGDLWILGMKNEQFGTVLRGNRGSRTEILGNQVYPARGVPAGMADVPAYDLRDARMSVSAASFIGFGGQYRWLVEERRGGILRRLPLSRADRYWRLPMFTTG